MKILFLALAHPNKKSGANTYVKNLLSKIQKKIDTHMIWVVCEPKKIQEEKSETYSIHDIRNFENAVEIIKETNPDCVLAINNKFNPTQHAISIAAKFQNIPLIHFKVIEKAEDEIEKNQEIKNLAKTTVHKIRRFANENTLNDSDSKNLKKRDFILYKHKFLYKTRSKTKFNTIQNIYYLFNDVSSYFWKKERMYTIADLQLVNNHDWMQYFKKIGFKEDKLSLTGSPIWDPIYEKIIKIKTDKVNFNGRQIQILIITAPLVEHGYGTYNERDSFLKNIIDELILGNCKIDLKIHPSSESKKSYQEFFQKNKFEISIYQNEKLWDIIEKYDVVVTYGYGYPQIECAFGGIRTILCETRWNFPKIPIVKTAIKSGYFTMCTNFKDIIPTIQNLLNKEIKINEEMKAERENLSYKFDGKAAERATTAILDLLKK